MEIGQISPTNEAPKKLTFKLGFLSNVGYATCRKGNQWLCDCHKNETGNGPYDG